MVLGILSHNLYFLIKEEDLIDDPSDLYHFINIFIFFGVAFIFIGIDFCFFEFEEGQEVNIFIYFVDYVFLFFHVCFLYFLLRLFIYYHESIFRSKMLYVYDFFFTCY